MHDQQIGSWLRPLFIHINDLPWRLSHIQKILWDVYIIKENKAFLMNKHNQWVLWMKYQKCSFLLSQDLFLPQCLYITNETRKLQRKVPPQVCCTSHSCTPSSKFLLAGPDTSSWCCLVWGQVDSCTWKNHQCWHTLHHLGRCLDEAGTRWCLGRSYHPSGVRGTHWSCMVSSLYFF